MKTQLMKRHKAREFAVHKAQIADLVNEVKNDFVIKILATKDKEHMRSLFSEIEEFKSYIQKAYKNVHEVFGLKSFNWT